METRVLVVPTETGNGIDQSSSVEEILNCGETMIYYTPQDVFQALNDEDLSDRHWFFMIDWDKKEFI